MASLMERSLPLAVLIQPRSLPLAVLIQPRSLPLAVLIQPRSLSLAALIQLRQSLSFKFNQEFFALDAAAVSGQIAVRSDQAVAGNDD